MKEKSIYTILGKLINFLVVCAIERFIREDTDIIRAAYPIAGALDQGQGGKPLDPKWTLLRKSTSNEDSKKEGLLLEIYGGSRPVEGKKKPQKGVIEFLCDRDRDGLENLIDPEDKYDSPKEKREEEKKDDDDNSEEEDDSKSSSLQFVRYDTQNSDVDVLRLKWRTKYACEDTKGNEDAEKKSGWGFFTWFILM